MNAVVQLRHAMRTMRETDVPVVLGVEHDCYEFPWSAGNFIDALRAGYRCWVYEVGGEIIGHVIHMVVLDEAHLLNLAIAPRWQRQGLGKALLCFAQDEMRQLGVSMVYLEVRPSNTDAIRLYNRNGFEGFAIRKGYYPAGQGREDALVMRCKLEPKQ